MKSRITAKFLVVAALLVLVINVFSSFGSLFVQAQTTSSGYKIGVTYQGDSTAQLVGDTTEVLPGYQLTSLVDDSNGQQYDPNKFSMQITKNGTYSFTLSYTLNGISTQTHSEKVQVVVDKLAKGNATEVKSTDTMSIAELNARATESNLTADAYAYELVDASGDDSYALLKGNVSIPSGDFESNSEDLTLALGDGQRSFIQAYLYRKSDTSKIPLVAAWKIGSDIYYEVKPTNEASPVAYKAQSGESIRLYYQITSSTKRTINIDNLSANGLLNIEVSPQQDSIYAGMWVVVSFTWPASIKSINGMNVSGVGQQDITVISNDSSTRQYAFRFKMPNSNVTITGDYNKKSGSRWVGIYDNSSRYYQSWELGYTSLAVASTNGDPGTIKDLTGSKGAVGTSIEQPYPTWSFLYRYWANRWNQYNGALSKDNPDTNTIKAYGSDPTYGNSDNIYGYTSASGFWYEFPIVHYEQYGSGNSGTLVNGKYNDTSISFPVQDFEAGNTVCIGIQSKRGKPVDGKYASLETLPYQGYDKKTGFLYYPISTIRLDVFSEPGTMTGDKYVSYAVNCYQNASDYQKQVAAKVPNLPTDSTGVSGLYPVSTELPNGMQVICIPTEYTPKSSTFKDYGGGNNDMTLPYYAYKVLVYNAYDDFRVNVTGNTSGANNWYRFGVSSGIDNISMNAGTSGVQNGNVQKDYTVTASQMPKTSDGSYYMQLDVKTKKGYTAPKPTFQVAYANNDASSSDLGKLDIQDRSTVGDVGSAGHNPLIFTKMSSGDKFYNSDKGYRYYIWIDGQNGTSHTLSFNSQPIKFSYTFNGLSGVTGNDYNVDTKRYFSIPVVVPVQTNKFFKGWELKVTGKGITETTLVNSADGSKIYRPGDLVDVENIYNQIVSFFTYDVISNTSGFTITAEPQYGSEQEAITAPATITRQYQNGYSNSYGDSEIKGPYQLLKNRAFRLSEAVAPTYIDKQSKKYRINSSSITFVDNFSGSTTGEAVNISTLSYDRAYKITYNLGAGSSTGSIPGIGGTKVDNNYYTLGSDTTTNTVTLPSASQITPPNNKTFVGWKITSGSVSQRFDKDKKSINLGTELDSNLAKALLDSTEDTITLTAEYQEEVLPVKNAFVANTVGGDKEVSMSDPDYGGSTQGKWIYSGGGETGQSMNDKTFTIIGKFKYADNNATDNETSYDNARTNTQIYYALYKQDPSKGAETTSDYKLWKATKNPNEANSSKVKDVKFSDNLDASGCFTVTATIQNASTGSTISYDWDNNARYRIFCWSSANSVNGTTFDREGNVKQTTISSSGTFAALPSYTTKTRVLEKLDLANKTGTSVSGSRINARKLIYNDQKLTISYEVTTGNSMLTKEEAEQEFNVAVGKQDPPKSGDAEGTNSSNIQLWYGKKPFSNFDSPGITTQGKEGSRNKLNVPTIELKDSVDGKSNKFTITVTGIGDNATATPRWQSEAKYYLYAWNGANTTPPTITKTPNGGTNNYTINNDSETVSGVPSKVYTTYIINDTKTEEKPSGRAFYGTVSYPANITVQENSSTKKLESSVMKVNLNASWVDSSGTTHGNTGGITPSAKVQPVEHDFSYGVTLTGGNVSTSSSGTSVKLTQGTSTKSVDAKILNASGGAISNGSLGTLDFYANNPSGVQELGFKLQTDSIPSSLTKDVFSGIIGYTFTRNDLTGGGST